MNFIFVMFPNQSYSHTNSLICSDDFYLLLKEMSDSCLELEFELGFWLYFILELLNKCLKFKYAMHITNHNSFGSCDCKQENYSSLL